jgi:hypothetical protein
MEEPEPKYPVLIWALTIRGEMMAVHCADRAEALEIGRENMAAGVWRTWDAFETAGDNSAVEARKIASSHDKSQKSVRPRILADWTPPDAAAEAEAQPRVPVKKSRIIVGPQDGKRRTHEKEKPKATGTRRRRIIPD